MKRAFRWDPRSYEYLPCTLPEMAAVSREISALVDCARCGKNIPYRTSCVSLLIHDEQGFGYAVCQDCAREELKELHDAHYKGDV